MTQPSGYQLEAVGSGVIAKARLTFQTASNSESYRLLIHTASATTQNFTILFDNFVVGPQVVPLGAPVTDWVAYTPSVSAISGTLTNFTAQGYWRRKGDSADYKIRLVFTGSPGTWSNPLFSIPSGQVIDDTKFPGGSVSNYADENWGTAVDSGTQNYKSAARPYTTTTLIMQQLFVSGSTVVLNSYSQTSPFTWTSGDEIEFTVKNVPIVGWSSSTVVSSSADTRVVAASRNTLSSTTITLNTALNFTTLGYDTTGSYSSATTYTVPVPGIYRITATGFTLSSGTANLNVNVNGNGRALLTTIGTVRNSGSASINVVAGDAITIVSDTSVTASSTGAVSIYIERISGPSQIAASEVIECSYNSNTGLSLSAGVAAIKIYEDKITDTHNAYNTSTGVFTAPAPGYYAIAASAVGGAASLAVSDEFAVIFRKNSSEVYRDGVFSPVAATITQSARGYHEFWLNAGETLDVQLLSDKAMTTNAVAIRNTLHIHRLGGVM